MISDEQVQRIQDLVDEGEDCEAAGTRVMADQAYQVSMTEWPDGMLESIERAALEGRMVSIAGSELVPAMCALDWMRGVRTIGGHIVDEKVHEALGRQREGASDAG